MCGIFFCCCCSTTNSDQPHRDCADGLETAESRLKIVQEILDDPALENRGPDLSKQHTLPLSSECINGWMRGCVLHLRGQPTHQPLVDDKGNALLWNGEIFDGIEVLRDENDTQVLFHQLTKCESDEDVLKTLEKVKGPWAVIFWQAERNMLWFGRDVYGRRSLLWHLPKDSSDMIVLTSVALGNLEYTEIPSVGIFALDLSSISSKGDYLSSPSITLHPWRECKWPGTRQSVVETQQQDLYSFLTPNQPPSVMSITIDRNQVLKYWMPEISKSFSFSSSESNSSPTPSHHVEVDDGKDLVKQLESIAMNCGSLKSLSEELVATLQDAVMKRVNCLPKEDLPSTVSENVEVSDAKIAVLFSGGLDSSVIAGLLDRCLPPEEPIDLLNVAFEQSRPAKTTAKVRHRRHKHKKNKSSHQQEKTESNSDSVPSDIPLRAEATPEDAGIQQELHGRSIHVNEGLVESHTLESSPSPSISSNEQNLSSASSPLCEEVFNSKCHVDKPSTPLSPSTLETDNLDMFDPYDVPDRRTGHIAFSELNPKRRWNFIEINVSKEELQTLRSRRIGKLIYPLQTVLDDSIGCAVWFAARGQGRLASADGDQHIIASKAKVILCGMAADEQFAGYSRHRVHFHQFGEESLVNQLEQEMWRISSRNLGRDDRIIADHGKEARFPFLDETFTEFVSKIPVHVRANLHLPRGLGEKLLLRLSALCLGLRQTACQPKRAIQFGSKIAKLDDSKEKGSDVCHRLL